MFIKSIQTNNSTVQAKVERTSTKWQQDARAADKNEQTPHSVSVLEL